MKIYNIADVSDFAHLKIDKPLVMCIGLFDGIHQGHLQLIKKTLLLAKHNNLRPAAFTLSMSVKDFYARRHDFIYEQDQKIAIFRNLGLEYYFNYVVSPKTIGLDKKIFMEHLARHLNVQKIVVGENFRFGHKAQGDITDLQAYFKSANVTVVQTVADDHHQKISSSFIRRLLAEHAIVQANQLLIEPITHTSKVIQGKKLGTQIGYPTANQLITHPLLMPEGIYITKAKLWGKWHSSISCYWTVNDKLLLETHILNFDQMFYGQNLQVSFLKYVRANQKVNNMDELKLLIHNDCQQAYLYFQKNKQ